MKKTLIFTAILSIAFLSGCNNSPLIGENETKALQKIVDMYGGNCKATATRVNSSKTGIESSISLELKNSKKAEAYGDFIDLPLSNMAYLFYSGIDTTKINYNLITTIITHKDSTLAEQEYEIESLKQVSKCIPLFNKLADNFKTKSFKEVLKKFDPVIRDSTNLTEEKIERMALQIDNKHGAIKSTIYQGFRSGVIKNTSEPCFGLYGVVLCEKSYTDLVVWVSKRNLRDGKLITSLRDGKLITSLSSKIGTLYFFMTIALYSRKIT